MHSINQPFIKKTLILAFVNEQEIKQLNHQFRKKNTVTDILSFAPSAEDSLGELALCLPVICKKTPPAFSQQGWLCYLIVHGILHLLGFEHEDDKKQARKMYQLQNTVFEKLYPKSVVADRQAKGGRRPTGKGWSQTDRQRVVADRQAKGAALGDSRAGD